MYSDCKQRELDNLRSYVVSALTNRHIIITNRNESNYYHVTLTMTKSINKRPSNLIPFYDFMPHTYMFKTSYQIVNSSNQILNTLN